MNKEIASQILQKNTVYDGATAKCLQNNKGGTITLFSAAQTMLLVVKMQDSDHYKGREHSGIKHYLLESYLEMLFMIIGQHERRVCYVDCFSGPWKESDKKLSGTSIALSLDVMSKCRKNLREKTKPSIFELCSSKRTNRPSEN